MEKFGGDFLFHTRLELKDQDLFDSIPPFYCEVLKNWQTIKDTTQKIDTRATIEKELLWKKRHIKVGNKSIFIKKWHEKGINYVEDLLNEKNEFLSHEFFQQKFNIQTPYTTYFGVIHVDAFPKRWKKLLREPVNTCDSVVTIPKWMENTSRLTNKILYSEIITNKFVPPTSQRMLPEAGVLESEFKMIYTLPYKVTTETKLIMFQLKIVHNILPTNAFLSKINLSESDACNLCKAPNQTAPHLFINFNQTVVFWKLFKIWWKNKTNLCIHLLAKQILFGIIDTKETHNLLLNHLLLIAKYYIYSYYLNEQELNFKPYLNTVEK